MERLPVAGPWITDREAEYAADAAKGDWYADANRYTRRFETAFAEHVGVRYAISLPHCTAGLHLSLAAMGVGPGDEVIVPDVTWIASAAPIRYVGATTVFADIDPLTWCMTAESLAACITSRTKAVIAVDLYGSMPNMPNIRAACEAHGLALIEDAAEAVGSRLNNRLAGSFGDTGVFSFHGSKTLATGEGGMVVTNRQDLYDRIMFLRDHGRPPGDRFFQNSEIAFKYKMAPVQAALGLAQLERIEELVDAKRQIFGWYTQGLSDTDSITLNAEPAGVRNSYWMTTAIFDDRLKMTSRELMEVLLGRGIDTRPFFAPLSSIPAYRDTPQAQKAAQHNVVGQRIARCGINLPSALCLTQSDIARVCDTINDVIS